MRLDTACLVAPKPKVPSMPTRRAFLLAGAMFGVGSMIGGACGYALGATDTTSGDSKQETQIDVSAGLEPTGDSNLDFLRRLALQAPIEDLEAQSPLFLEGIRIHVGDRYLWHGMNRMADRFLARQHTKWPRLAHRVFLQTIRAADEASLPDNGLSLKRKLPELDRVK